MKIGLTKDRLTDIYVEILKGSTVNVFCATHKRYACPTCAAFANAARLPLGRRNQAQVADTVRKVTGKALEVAAFNSSIE